MTVRIAFIGAVTLVLSASSARAQGRPSQQVVLSEAVMKSMIANKPKSKTPLGSRLGMVRRSSVAAPAPRQAAPTSVREISPSTKKK